MINKKEAAELESTCAGYLKKALERGDVYISTNLSGRLCITYANNYMSVDDSFTAIYNVNYRGYYHDLEVDVSAILECICEHEDDFRLLLWILNNPSSLEE